MALTLLAGASCSSGATEAPESKSSTVSEVGHRKANEAPAPAAPRAPETTAEEVEKEPEYALDRSSRKVPMSGKLVCPPVELMEYQGKHLAYDKPARIYVGFAEHLERFEILARDTAIEIYGRAPTRIRTYGSYYCRRIRTWGYLVSEHGLGNALDVAGFEFGKVKGSERSSVPTQWQRSFKVSMSKHWRASSEREATHSKFLRTLAQRVIDEEGLFRVILGPADPKHQDHFHFDMAPFRIVNVFD
jgi:hypothetical protein